MTREQHHDPWTKKTIAGEKQPIAKQAGKRGAIFPKGGRGMARRGSEGGGGGQET